MSRLLDILEQLAREQGDNDIRVTDIAQHGEAFFIELTRRAVELTKVDKNNTLGSIKTATCSVCGGEATRYQKQLRAADEGANTVVVCSNQSCRTTIVLA